MRGDHRSQPRPAGYASLLRYRAAQWSPVPSRNAARDGTGAPVEIIEITADTSALRAIVRDLLQTFRMQVPGRGADPVHILQRDGVRGQHTWSPSVMDLGSDEWPPRPDTGGQHVNGLGGIRGLSASRHQ